MRTARGSFSQPTNGREMAEVRKLVEMALRRITEQPPAQPALVKVQPTEPPGPVGTAWLDTSVQA